MLSIVICSVSPERLQQIALNIQDTIGVEYEIIAIDNREKNWPIARVYNEGAYRAQYPYLFFVHEDVKFHSQNWGIVIEEKLKEPNCGVIGFAGTRVMLNCYSGWLQSHHWMCLLLYQGLGEGMTELRAHHAYLEHPFEEVIALDGLGMFVRKEVWEEYPFDEVMLTGFHCYDVDFSLQIAASKKYKNYVCCSTKVLIEHFSPGNLNHSWYKDTIRFHKQKWNKILPMKIDGMKLSHRDEKKYKERCFYYFVRGILQTNYPERKLMLKEFLFCSCSWKHLGHCITNLYKYIKS